MPLHPHRWRHALLVSIASVGLLSWGLVLQQWGGWWMRFTVHPRETGNLLTGWAYVFFHASAAHLLANAMALLVLGTLSLGLYPRATKRALPLAWLGSFLLVWSLGEPGSRHLGASGLAYGLMSMLTMLGVLRRDRPAIAVGLLVWFFFASAWWAMLPGYPGVSWQGHLGGALGGALGAWLCARMDPNPFPVPQWDDEGEDGRGDLLEDGSLLPPPGPRIGYNDQDGLAGDRE